MDFSTESRNAPQHAGLRAMRMPLHGFSFRARLYILFRCINDSENNFPRGNHSDAMRRQPTEINHNNAAETSQDEH
ncbi:hypothetical protein DZB54_11695 [Herbaspirillum sp. 3R-3a1]|nr:hypothetical protein DZB54_11695 [Herbaspirillum sp. 3R-3a1]